MTVVVALRVPKHGAVIATDSRVVGSDGRIWSEDARKVVRFSGVTVAVAGDLAVLTLLRSQNIMTLGDVRDFVSNIEGDDLDFTLVSYDRIRDRLWVMEDTGGELECPYSAVIGSGSSVASGALASYPTAKTMKDAVAIAKKATSIACRLHVECGGRVRTITASVL